MKTCSIEGCTKALAAWGWCKTHWARWRRNGDPTRVKKHFEYVLKGEKSRQYKHGCVSHHLYGVWSNMMRRCYDVKNKSYPRYGGRGITVCKEWHDIHIFINDVGERPSGLSLERKNNNEGYCPENCIWADKKQQARNRCSTKMSAQKAQDVIEMKKEGMKNKDIAHAMGVHISTIKKIWAGTTWS